VDSTIEHNLLAPSQPMQHQQICHYLTKKAS
jgi:hypothetical protein